MFVIIDALIFFQTFYDMNDNPLDKFGTVSDSVYHRLQWYGLS